MESADFRRWCATLGHPFGLHRKFWEHCFIAQALDERGMLRPGRRGLGFGVGKEPLAACFAGKGCEIVATDLAEDRAVASGWADGRQHANCLQALNEQGLCDPDSFRKRVSFRFVDMNAIPDDLRGFDFTWSSCSFEHVGSIDLGMRFIANMLRCLRPGGVAVHTTEFNLSSDDETLSEGPTVIFRRRDIVAMADRLAADGHKIDLDLDPGDGPADKVVDVPPYTHVPHLKLQLDRYVSTSIGLIIEKAGPFSAVVRLLRRRLPLRRAS
jgi:SAM-dependent methyltransferase